MSDEVLVTVKEAARRLSIARSHLYQHLQRGSLASLRIGRSRRIAVAELEAFALRIQGGEGDRSARWDPYR
jgi:excisionase family DNA binding protein